MSFANYWTKVVVINRDERTDRLAHMTRLARLYGFDFIRFRAHDGVNEDGKMDGNFGCTASHRGVLELIAHHGWERTLVLEDDAVAVEPGVFPQDAYRGRLPFEMQWATILPELPKDWRLLYLGAHYADRPRARLSPHIIVPSRVLTTSSYAVTAQQARDMARFISGSAPIDNQFWRWNRMPGCYVTDPRLFVQLPGVSDLHHKREDYVGAMLTDVHGDGWRLSDVRS